MNTWYKKGRSKRGTWTHPATRQVHLIDYVIMRTAHCCYCKDVGVVRGTLCWTDHCMVRAKLVLDFVQCRFTLPKRRSYATHRLREPDTLLQYRESMEAACGGVAGGGQSVEETWNSLCDDITSVAERTLVGQRRQPDWFLENRAALEPRIEAKRRAHERMLSAGNQTTRSGFRSAQRSVAKAVRGAKEHWIREVVGDAERAQKDGCVRWKASENYSEWMMAGVRSHPRRFMMETDTLLTARKVLLRVGMLNIVSLVCMSLITCLLLSHVMNLTWPRHLRR